MCHPVSSFTMRAACSEFEHILVGVREKPRKSVCDPTVPPPPTQLGDDIGVLLVSGGPQ